LIPIRHVIGAYRLKLKRSEAYEIIDQSFDGVIVERPAARGMRSRTWNGGHRDRGIRLRDQSVSRRG